MSEENVCRACNANNQVEAKFCAECGTNLELPEMEKKIKTEYQIEPEKLDKMMNLLKYLDEQAHIKTEFENQQDIFNKMSDQLDKAKEEVNRFKTQLDQEIQDVENLQNFTFTKFVAKIKGDHEEQLSKEQEEVALKKEKLAAAEKNLEEVQKQYENVKSDLQQIEELKAHYDNVKQEFNELLEKVYEGKTHPEEDKVEEKLNVVTDEFNWIKKKIKDRNLALNYLNSAKEQLDIAESELSSAGRYATWDSFFDGGLIADTLKHNKWDNARTHMKRANRNLNQAEQYLSEEVERANADRSGSDFFDVWMDNIFSDFRARSEINQSKQQVQRVQEEVEGMISKVKRTKSKLNDQLEELANKKNNLEHDLRAKRIELLEEYSKTKSAKE